MKIDLNDQEVEYLVDLLEAAHKELLPEVHRTDSLEYKEQLIHRVELNESISAKLGHVAVAR